MKQAHPSQLLLPSFGWQNTSDTRLYGYRLLLARIVWVVVAALSFSLFLLGLLPYAAQLHTVCTTNIGACYLDGALSPAGVQALHDLGLSVDGYVWYTVVVTLLVALVWASVGLVIFWRRSDDWMALIGALFLVTFNPTLTGGPTASLVQVSPSWTIPIECLDFLATVLDVLFFLLFPNGRFVPRWMRWLLVPFIVQQSTLIFLPWNSPLNSNNWPAWLNGLLTLALVSSAIVSQIYRYRRVSTPTERQQTKWVLFGILITLIGMLALNLLPFSFNMRFGLFSVAQDSLYFIIFLVIPLSVGVAVLRYRLWDIDIIINRTLVYGTLTLSILGIYVLVVSALGVLLQAQGNVLISLLATGLVAVLFQSLRHRLQQVVNRLMYGDRDTPYQAIARLGQCLEATLAPDTVLPTIVETIAHALKLPHAAIRVKHDGVLSTAVSLGLAEGPLVQLPLLYQGEQVAELLLAPRTPGEGFSAADRRLLEDLARQAGIAVHTVTLTRELQQLTQDLQRSRTALVTAREEERRRLRRDLHDGLGSTLASLNWQTGALRSALTRDLVAADALIVEQQTIIRSTLADIRRLVYDLRPPSLDELGLVGALRERAAQVTIPIGALLAGEQGAKLHVTVEAAEALPPLPAALEVAAYRIVQEALTNVVRHAQATTCQVRLSIGAGSLQVEVSDDGVGLAPRHQAGIGLLSMQERAAEVGGTCSIHPGARGGTQVCAWLPFPAD